MVTQVNAASRLRASEVPEHIDNTHLTSLYTQLLKVARAVSSSPADVKQALSLVRSRDADGGRVIVVYPEAMQEQRMGSITLLLKELGWVKTAKAPKVKKGVFVYRKDGTWPLLLVPHADTFHLSTAGYDNISDLI